MESKELTKDEILHSHPIVANNKGSDLYITLEAARKSMDKYADQWKEKYDELKQEVAILKEVNNEALKLTEKAQQQCQLLKDKADKMEAALKNIIKWCEDSKLKDCAIDNPVHMAIYHSLHLSRNALSAWKEGKEVEGEV